MSKTVLVLGAGASSDAGAPVMASFLDRSESLLHSGVCKDDESDFKLVFRGIHRLQQVYAKASIDTTNLEAVFNAFEMAQLLEHLPGLENEERSALSSALRRVIVRTIEESIEYPFHDGAVHPTDSYWSLATLVANSFKDDRDSVSAITFNYDYAFDYALRFQGIVLNYHLDGAIVPDKFSLMKLHGSMNWYRTPDNFIRAFDLSSKYTRSNLEPEDYITEHDVRLKIARLNPPESRESMDPLIVPPNWDKAGHQFELAHVWAASARNLSEAECIVVIGYSLPDTDQFFRYLYALGTISHVRPKLFLLVDPNASLIQHRFEDMLGPLMKDRFLTVDGTFADFLQFTPGVQPTLESIVREWL